MKLTHLGHATVLVESAAGRLLIDPGNLSDAWHALTDLDAIAFTHQHPDHIDPDRVPSLLAANPQAIVLAEPQTAAAYDFLAGRAQSLAAGDDIDLAGFGIWAVGGDHAIIHRDLPQIGNCGLVVTVDDGPRLFHPGDSLATVPQGIDLLALPVMGPWAAVKEQIDFVRAVDPSQAFGIHDGLVNDRYWGLIARLLAELTSTPFADWRQRGSFTWEAA